MKKKKPLWGIKNKFPAFYARQLNDQDYINEKFIKEHPEAAKFYNEFAEEYYGNTFRNKEGLHDKAQIGRKELYNATNARHRDIYNMRLKTILINNQYVSIEDVEDRNTDSSEEAYASPEDSLIDLIDKKREGLVGFNE